MRSFVRRDVRWVAVLTGMIFTVALPILAQARDFTGKVQRIEKGPEGVLIVDNRQGDKLTFVRTAATKVRGAKSSWDAIRPKDWVTVAWEMKDNPRVAYVVRVLPPREQ